MYINNMLMMLQVNNLNMHFQLSQFDNFWIICFSNLLVLVEITVIFSLSTYIGIPVKISHVYRCVMEKINDSVII